AGILLYCNIAILRSSFKASIPGPHIVFSRIRLLYNIHSVKIDPPLSIDRSPDRNFDLLLWTAPSSPNERMVFFITSRKMRHMIIYLSYIATYVPQQPYLLQPSVRHAFSTGTGGAGRGLRPDTGRINRHQQYFGPFRISQSLPGRRRDTDSGYRIPAG